MSAPVVVTGATGFVGRHLVRRLVAEGTPVRVLVRDPGRLPADLRDRVDRVAGDLRDPDAVMRAIDGGRTVYHLAACARAWAPDPGLFHDVNVTGVRNVLAALRRRRPPTTRLVHVSTILTLPPHGASPLEARGIGATPYETSKAEGERLVDEYARDDGWAVVVHPTRVYGPGPLTDANGVTKMLALYLAGRFRLRIADGGARANYVHVEDVADGILRAGRRGARGSHYVLGGEENPTLAAFLELAGRLAGRRPTTVAVPPGVVLALARLDVLRGRLGGEPSLTPGWIRVFTEDRPADVTPARQQLGYRPRPLEAGLRETLSWLERRDGGRPG